ncbi:hypothetical protein [Pseudomonas sp. N040]|uniref:hypothetical protein n=1 Tax=Pseudomonas sp. N040 TaxID=2785325 RepID=UPI0018A29F5C|nr:hypothetical protein [Pseudomonas sp. N040]MBF7731116.1 hypothetical protein [Pseudomonas sp. N040]MBW7014759.1 hypothetical protein [Pseudomonas sp. N040]
MFNHEMMMASGIWGFLGAALFLLWCFLGFLVQKVGLFSATIESRRSQILSAFRWVWLLPMHIAWIALILALVWNRPVS